MKNIFISNECPVYTSPPDPTLTIENVISVMETVAVDRRKSILVPDTLLEECYQNYACADIYVNCHPESSWTHLCQRLWNNKEVTAARKAKTFIPQTGR